MTPPMAASGGSHCGSRPSQRDVVARAKANWSGDRPCYPTARARTTRPRDEDNCGQACVERAKLRVQAYGWSLTCRRPAEVLIVPRPEFMPESSSPTRSGRARRYLGVSTTPPDGSGSAHQAPVNRQALVCAITRKGPPRRPVTALHRPLTADAHLGESGGSLGLPDDPSAYESEPGIVPLASTRARLLRVCFANHPTFRGCETVCGGSTACSRARPRTW
jgi:hypothetical protein